MCNLSKPSAAEQLSLDLLPDIELQTLRNFWDNIDDEEDQSFGEPVSRSPLNESPEILQGADGGLGFPTESNRWTGQMGSGESSSSSSSSNYNGGENIVRSDRLQNDGDSNASAGDRWAAHPVWNEAMERRVFGDDNSNVSLNNLYVEDNGQGSSRSGASGSSLHAAQSTPSASSFQSDYDTMMQQELEWSEEYDLQFQAQVQALLLNEIRLGSSSWNSSAFPTVVVEGLVSTESGPVYSEADLGISNTSDTTNSNIYPPIQEGNYEPAGSEYYGDYVDQCDEGASIYDRAQMEQFQYQDMQYQYARQEGNYETYHIPNLGAGNASSLPSSSLSMALGPTSSLSSTLRPTSSLSSALRPTSSLSSALVTSSSSSSTLGTSSNSSSATGSSSSLSSALGTSFDLPSGFGTSSSLSSALGTSFSGGASRSAVSRSAASLFSSLSSSLPLPESVTTSVASHPVAGNSRATLRRTRPTHFSHTRPSFRCRWGGKRCDKVFTYENTSGEYMDHFMKVHRAVLCDKFNDKIMCRWCKPGAHVRTAFISNHIHTSFPHRHRRDMDVN